MSKNARLSVVVFIPYPKVLAMLELSQSGKVTTGILLLQSQTWLNQLQMSDLYGKHET